MRKNKRYKGIIVVLIVIYLLITIISGIDPFSKKIDAQLISCVDGDTVVLKFDNQDETIRLLAVDTPERRQPYYQVASDFTCKLLEDSHQIQLEIDKNASYDSYNRLLVWLWIDDELLQEKLVEAGLAKVAYLYDDYKYTDNLIELQEKAMKNKINLWSLPNP